MVHLAKFARLRERIGFIDQEHNPGTVLPTAARSPLGSLLANFIFNDHFPFPNGPEGAFVHLGLPHYFKIELTTAKILGVLALLIPSVPFKIKEFAYFGFGITLLSASIAHFARGDARLGVFFIIDPLFFLVLLIASYVYSEKRYSFSARQSPEG